MNLGFRSFTRHRDNLRPGIHTKRNPRLFLFVRSTTIHGGEWGGLGKPFKALSRRVHLVIQDICNPYTSNSDQTRSGTSRERCKSGLYTAQAPQIRPNNPVYAHRHAVEGGVLCRDNPFPGSGSLRAEGGGVHWHTPDCADNALSGSPSPGKLTDIGGVPEPVRC